MANRKATRKAESKIEIARQIVRKHANEYEAEFGVGPCGALAVILQEAGWGKLAYAETKHSNLDMWYPHYVVVQAGQIIDISGEYLQHESPNVQYRDMEIMEEPGDQLWGEDDFKFWRTRLAEVL